LACKPKDVRQAAALDVWRVSYFCNGMNMADMAHLSADMVAGDLLAYNRKKTARTKQKSKPIVIVLRKEIKHIMSRGGKTIFGVLDGTEGAERERKLVMQWTHTTNKWLKRLGEKLGLSVKLTTYTARHTAATMMLKGGTDIVGIMEALGHSSVNTTKEYLASLDLEGRRDIAARL